MSSPSPADKKEGLPWIIKPGAYKWVDDIFNTPLKQWGTIIGCVICCIFIILLLASSSGKNEQSFSSYMKDAVRKKLMDLTM
jgi:hypothetical protein